MAVFSSMTSIRICLYTNFWHVISPPKARPFRVAYRDTAIVTIKRAQPHFVAGEKLISGVCWHVGKPNDPSSRILTPNAPTRKKARNAPCRMEISLVPGTTVLHVITVVPGTSVIPSVLHGLFVKRLGSPVAFRPGAIPVAGFTSVAMHF